MKISSQICMHGTLNVWLKVWSLGKSIDKGPSIMGSKLFMMGWFMNLVRIKGKNQEKNLLKKKAKNKEAQVNESIE